VTLLKRNELSASKPGDGLGTFTALLGVQIAVAVGAVWRVILGRELLLRQLLVAVVADEALAMPRLVLVGHTPLVDHPTTLGALLGKLLLVAGHAAGLLLARDEALVADWLTAHHAREALLVHLLPLVLKLLHTSLKRLGTGITPSCEVVIMAVCTEDLVVLGGERLIDERLLALETLETKLVPVVLLVGQILVVGSDGFLALLAVVGEEFLVAGDAVGVLLLENVAARDQLLVAVLAGKMVLVVVVLHGLCVLRRKYQQKLLSNTFRPL